MRRNRVTAMIMATAIRPASASVSYCNWPSVEPLSMMARAMRHAVEAGRLAYLAGRMAKKRYADPSSPLAGLI